MKREIMCGDALEELKGLADGSVHCCVTSPPYWGLRDYGVEGQVGLEETPEEYVESIVGIFREVKRVLREDGTVWLVLGDSYTPVNRGENARPRRETLTGIQAGQPHADLQTCKASIQAVAAMGLKPKDLVGIPWRVAFALQADGWWLRSDIIWAKPNPMPESVRDRPTKAHEYIFLLSKSQKYHYDHEAIKEPQEEYERLRRLREKEEGLDTRYEIASDGKIGQRPQSSSGAIKNSKARQELAETGKRNKRTVWTMATKPFKEAHFAVFPPDLIRPCVLAGCPPKGTVLDPFFGAGTTGLVAKQEGRGYIGIELNPEYAEMARERIRRECPMERLV